MSRPQQNRAETPISQGGRVLHGLFLAFALLKPDAWPTAILSDEKEVKAGQAFIDPANKKHLMQNIQQAGRSKT
jgi:hypothetical protein